MSITDVEVRSDENAIIIKWMASTPEIDRYNSIITADWIRWGMDNYIANPVILLGHDSDKAIWTMIEHKVDNTGLFITAKLTMNLDNVFQAIKEGITKGFSIGFYPLSRSYETKDWTPLAALTQEQLDQLDYNDIIRKITKLDLVEISVVNVPANPSALFTMQKAVKLFFESIEKRSVIELQKREAEEVEEVVTDEVEEVQEVEEQTEVQEEVKEEVKEEVQEENVSEETQDNQGDEVEAAGENPDTPAEEDNDPTTEVETPSDTTETVETPVAQPASEELQRAYELVDQCIDTIEKLTGKVNSLEALMSQIPSKRWLVVTGSQTKEDPLLKQMRDAKAAALGNI